jgi:hypothetical protein
VGMPMPVTTPTASLGGKLSNGSGVPLWRVQACLNTGTSGVAGVPRGGVQVNHMHTCFAQECNTWGFKSFDTLTPTDCALGRRPGRWVSRSTSSATSSRVNLEPLGGLDDPHDGQGLDRVESVPAGSALRLGEQVTAFAGPGTGCKSTASSSPLRHSVLPPAHRCTPWLYGVVAARTPWPAQRAVWFSAARAWARTISSATREIVDLVVGVAAVAADVDVAAVGQAGQVGRDSGLGQADVFNAFGDGVLLVQ